MGQEPLLLTAISRRIAKHFDILASRLCTEKRHDTCASLHHFYGAELFYCPISSCSRHVSGFEKRDKREAHTAKHQRPVKCDVLDCDFSSIGFESEADRANHMSDCHNLAFEELTWEDMDDESFFRVLCSASRQGEFGLAQSLLSLISQKIIGLGGFGKLLLAAGEGQSVDIINLVISVCKSIREATARSHLKGDCDSLNEQLEEALNNAALSGLEALVRGMCRNGLFTDLNNSAGQLSLNGKKVHPGYKPLHLAVLGLSESIVEQLLDSGASVAVQSKKGHLTPLHLAAERHEGIARLLIDRGANIEAKYFGGRTALHYAAQSGHEATVRLLLDRGANANAQYTGNRTALHIAAGNGHEAIARLLLDRGADIKSGDSSGQTALHDAAGSGREALAQLLLDRGADIECKNLLDQTALHRAAKDGNEATARLLLDRGADIETHSAGGQRALHGATGSGHEALARLLLDRGADIECRDSFGQTALHCAAKGGNVAAARLLLDRGADIECKDAGGLTALHRAASSGQWVAVRLLLDRGADIECKDADGWTALHLAARDEDEAAARLLLDCGADIE